MNILASAIRRSGATTLFAFDGHALRNMALRYRCETTDTCADDLRCFQSTCICSRFTDPVGSDPETAKVLTWRVAVEYRQSQQTSRSCSLHIALYLQAFVTRRLHNSSDRPVAPSTSLTLNPSPSSLGSTWKRVRSPLLLRSRSTASRPYNLS